MNRTLTITFLLLLLSGWRASAQMTGSFNTDITFNGQPRQLSLYVPSGYNPANKYQLMICLHGLGDNSTNYRNALITALGWNTAYPNTIFVCPEAAATNADYYAPAGGEAIIPASISYAMNTYHIDTANVVLQGFSLGGRAALRYGLDHYSTFKGLLLNTPAVQGVKEALNASSNYSYNYANAANIPVYITHGGADILYTGAIDTTYEQLVVNNCKVKLLRIPAMAHTIPPVTRMADYPNYFNSPGNAPYDLDILKVTAPDRTCTAAISSSCLIRNAGNNTLTSAKIHYTSGTVTGDYVWTGTLLPFQHAVVNLPVINAASGLQTITAAVTQLNGSLTDTVTFNNRATADVIYGTSGVALPLTEGFETAVFPPANWLLHGSGEAYAQLGPDDDVKKTGTASVTAFNTILIFDNARRREELLSPMLDLTSAINPALSFDVAYNYHRYTAPYFIPDTNFADTLEVLVSTDCGDTYQSVYKKGGSQLATFSAPIMNPLDVNSCFANPADSNWRREVVLLSPFATSNKAIVKFRYTSALGGSFNMDNIRFATLGMDVPEVTRNTVKIFPNPASNRVTITAPNGQLIQVSVLDMAGKLIPSIPASALPAAQASLDITTLPGGIYFIRVQTSKGVQTERLMIAK